VNLRDGACYVSLPQMLMASLLALIALIPVVLFVRADKSGKVRARRLAELDAGAPESYFEERRALEVYPNQPLEGRARTAAKIAYAVILVLVLLNFADFLDRHSYFHWRS